LWYLSGVDFRFAKGDRVSVADTYHWAQDALGTIDEPPEQVAALAEGWQGVVRMVQTTSGPCPFYWVSFDEPHRDAEGDGPYGGAEIPENALKKL
jgi:hypothetical protein